MKKIILALVLALSSLATFAQSEVIILQNNRPQVRHTEFEGQTKIASFLFKTEFYGAELQMVDVKIKVGKTEDGLKAEVISSKRHFSWSGPKAVYSTDGDQIVIEVSALDHNKDVKTIVRSYQLNEQDEIEEIE